MTSQKTNKAAYFSYQYSLICLLLVIATLVVYWPVKDFEFIDYDDNEYVSENSYIKEGVTLEGVIWSLTADHSANWHPITWLSHMLDVQIFGMDAGWHHLTSLAFHIANILLLFHVLLKMTGNLWQSGFVAALFALHPLQVESVAWVAERKNVLSTFFWMLTLWTYAGYTKQPGYGRYLIALFVFTLGLMAKPMLVTLPFILLLMDYWPLDRLKLLHSNRKDHIVSQKSAVLHLFLEKIPFLLLSMIVCIITISVQQQWQAVASFDEFPLSLRVSNALISYIRYIGLMIWPFHNAIIYPYPGSVAIWQTIGSVALLIGLSAIAIRTRRKFPYITVGWLWYIGTLVPVIGLVQVGKQAMADRYTYIPIIGILIILAWGVPALISRRRRFRIMLGAFAVILLSGFMVLTRVQLSYWKNEVILFKHAVNVTENNWFAHNHLGIYLKRRGNLEEAISHYSKALRIKPDNAILHNNMGNALVARDRLKAAAFHYYEAIRLNPGYASAHNNLGIVLERQGRLDEAGTHFRKALQIEPDRVATKKHIEIILLNQAKRRRDKNRQAAPRHDSPP